MVKGLSLAEVRALKRDRSRLQIINGGRQYAAAKTTRLTGDWIPVNQHVNDIIRTSAPMLRTRIRQLVRDFPYFDRACNILVDFTVGSGTNFQSRVLNPDWTPGAKGVPKFDRKACQQIEDAVAWWAEEADAAGCLHFAELERLAKRQEVESGEFVFVKTSIRDPRRYLPFALQVVEPDWLSDFGASVQSTSSKLDQGIEYDKATGRPLTYFLAAPNSYGKSNPYAADDIIHGFETRRPGQLRGVSPFAAAVLVAHDLNDYLDATIDTAKLAAKYLALVTTPDPASFQDLRSSSEDGQKIEALENAIIEYLRPGEDVKFAQNNNPGSSFDPYTRFILRMVAVATGTTYSLLSGDYTQTNYTTLRGERQDLLRMFKPHQDRHVRRFVSPVIRQVIEQAVMAGRIDLPGYWRDPRRYWRGVFISPGMEPIDPLRESKANRDDMAAGLRSPQEIAAKRGRDLEEVLDELAEFQEMVNERGLLLDMGSTAMANNPATNGADELEEKSLSRLISRAIEDALDRHEMLKEE